MHMGILDAIAGKKDAEKEQDRVENSSQNSPAGKYSEPCSLCNKLGTEKKWMGKYWHVKCFRSARKMAKRRF